MNNPLGQLVDPQIVDVDTQLVDTQLVDIQLHQLVDKAYEDLTKFYSSVEGSNTGDTLITMIHHSIKEDLKWLQNRDPNLLQKLDYPSVKQWRQCYKEVGYRLSPDYIKDELLFPMAKIIHKTYSTSPKTIRKKLGNIFTPNVLLFLLKCDSKKYKSLREFWGWWKNEPERFGEPQIAIPYLEFNFSARCENYGTCHGLMEDQDQGYARNAIPVSFKTCSQCGK